MTQKGKVPTKEEVEALCALPDAELRALKEDVLEPGNAVPGVTHSSEGELPPPRALEDVAAERAMCDELVDMEATQRTRKKRNPVSRVTLPRKAVELLAEYAAGHGVTLKTYLEAVLHYVISTERRPGSWEGSQPFEFRTYDTRRPEGAYADRWF